MSDIQPVEEFKRTRSNKLRAIELQIAHFGEASAPVHLIIERDDLQREIAAADAALKPRISAELIAGLDPVQRHLQLVTLVMDTQADVKEVKIQAAEDKAIDTADREHRQQETDVYRVSNDMRLNTIQRLMRSAIAVSRAANWKAIAALILAAIALVLNLLARWGI